MYFAQQNIAADLPATQIGARVCLVGRVIAIRRMKRTAFFDLRDRSGTAQCSLSTPTFDTLSVSIGDIIRIEGSRGDSKTGASILEVDELAILSRTADPGALSDDIRAGRFHRTRRSVRNDRAREILVDDNLRGRLYLRSKILYLLRERLAFHGFDEFDIPVIVPSAFVGTARLFELKSQDIDGRLYLRGSLESHLKQLMVAGFESAYCIGPSFRNESAELHEFLMVEGVSAQLSQLKMINTLEDIIRYVANGVSGLDQAATTRVEELSRPWDKSSFSQIFQGDTSDAHEVKRAFIRLRDDLSDSFETPLFINDFPAIISPLAAASESDPALACRGYMFYRGFRICEIVQEQTSADQQLSVFESQHRALCESAHTEGGRSQWSYDAELIEALRLGCPPLAGFGLHVNRLVAAISETDHVSDVVPFPLASGRIAR